MQQLSAEERMKLEELKNDTLIYIARDSDGELWAYDTTPDKSELYWNVDCSYCISVIIFEDFLKFIKWENDTPHEIEKLLEGEK